MARSLLFYFIRQTFLWALGAWRILTIITVRLILIEQSGSATHYVAHPVPPNSLHAYKIKSMTKS